MRRFVATLVVVATIPGCSPSVPQVTGLTAGLSGGSEEVFVEWDASTDPNLDHYTLYYSENPGEEKTLLSEVPPDETSYIDFPRDLTEGTNCYEVTAVNTDGNESARSDEACFTAS